MHLNATLRDSPVSLAPADADLVERLEALRAFVPPGAPVVLFDHAVYPNVGDLLITKATEEFLKGGGNRIIDAYSVDNYAIAMRRRFPEDAIFVFQGGGNFGDLYPHHDRQRLEVMGSDPKRRAVVMPQTIYFRNPDKLRRIAEAYGRFPNLTIVGRDTTSHALLERYFTNPVGLAPDIAHVLTGRFPTAIRKREHLYFIRRDESRYSVTGLSILDGIPEDAMDWPDFLTTSEYYTIRAAKFALRAEKNIGRHWPGAHTAWTAWRDRLLARAARTFAESDCVVTNRLHGTIFGLICGKPVEIIDTGYGKLSSYYESWLESHDAVTLRTPDIHLEGMACHL